MPIASNSANNPDIAGRTRIRAATAAPAPPDGLSGNNRINLNRDPAFIVMARAGGPSTTFVAEISKDVDGWVGESFISPLGITSHAGWYELSENLTPGGENRQLARMSLSGGNHATNCPGAAPENDHARAPTADPIRTKRRTE